MLFAIISLLFKYSFIEEGQYYCCATVFNMELEPRVYHKV